MADLVLYDGVCGLCNRLVQFILARDIADHFRFASLQSSFSIDLVRRFGRDATDLDTVYVVADYGSDGERLLSKGSAIIHVLRSLGGIWKLAALARVFPIAWIDVLYALIARRRYRWFGRSETCLVAPESHRAKFLDGSS